MIKEKSKIDFDYEVKKIYKEKSYDSLEECIKDVEFPKNSDGIYADEKDFRSAFKDTKYIKNAYKRLMSRFAAFTLADLKTGL